MSHVTCVRPRTLVAPTCTHLCACCHDNHGNGRCIVSVTTPCPRSLLLSPHGSGGTAFPKVALSDYKGMSDTEVDLRTGEAINITEVADDWSYAVRKRGGEGWVPSEFVGASPSKPVKPAAPKPAVPKPPAGKDSKQYTCLRDCKGETPQEISLKAGDVVTLIEPDTDGWCFVSCRGKEGWVAADCLKQG
eukprot:m.941555 g.941555  ORF g.941555 m.941555 type:complete len:190 (-) comp23834_c2_seq8:577-1146(-)